jgi:hypothetical protein
MLTGALPRCFGTYASDPVCDGDPKGKDDVARAACGLRAECIQFARKVLEHGVNRMDFIGYNLAPNAKIISAYALDPQRLDSLLVEMKEMTGPIPEPPGLETLAPVTVYQRRYFRWSHRFPGFSDLIDHWHRMLSRQLPWASFNQPPDSYLPGQIWIKDEAEHLGRLSYRFKRGVRVTQEFIFARVLFRPSLKALHVLLPLTPQQIAEFTGGYTVKVLNPRTYRWSGGYAHKDLPSICRGLGKEGLSLAAEVIGIAAKKGVLNFTLEVKSCIL